jgi:hypothetical protein
MSLSRALVAVGSTVIFVIGLTACGEREFQPSKNQSIVNSPSSTPSSQNTEGNLPQQAPQLPSHTVASDTSIAPKAGRRIELHSSDTELSKAESIALINAYRKKAGPDGQVSVRKPSKVLKNRLTPYAIENFDGNGVVFNDHMF